MKFLKNTLTILFLNFLFFAVQARTQYQVSINNIPFNCVWSSTYGDINWSKKGDFVSGYYSNSDKTISGYLKEQANGSVVLEGVWGRKSSARSGKIKFIFFTPSKFEGTYNDNHNWDGKTSCTSLTSTPGNTNTRDRLTINTIPFNCVWSSTYGDIHWTRNGNFVSGYYSNSDKTISGYLKPQNNGSVILEGTWGRKSSNRSGKIKFIFHKTNKFEGTYNNNYNWDGKTSCKN